MLTMVRKTMWQHGAMHVLSDQVLSKSRCVSGSYPDAVKDVSRQRLEGKTQKLDPVCLW